MHTCVYVNVYVCFCGCLCLLEMDKLLLGDGSKVITMVGNESMRINEEEGSWGHWEGMTVWVHFLERKNIPVGYLVIPKPWLKRLSEASWKCILSFKTHLSWFLPGQKAKGTQTTPWRNEDTELADRQGRLPPLWDHWTSVLTRCEMGRPLLLLVLRYLSQSSG